MLLRGSSLAAASAAAASFTWKSSLLSAAATPDEPASEPKQADEKKKAECLHLLLQPSSSEEVLQQFPPTHDRVLGERVLVRQCIPEEFEDLPLRALAFAQDGESQSLLVTFDKPPWPESSPAPPGGIGYPLLPISLAEPPEPPAAPAEPAGEEGSDPEADAPRTPWEQAEELWRRLEAAGVLQITRGEQALPSSVSIAAGGDEWRGKLPPSAENPRESAVILRLVPPGGLELRGHTAVPECGFCKFMKAGPCGEEFKAWEACIDRARDSKEDFVEVCGAPTLRLKDCTDQHPEYSRARVEPASCCWP